MRIYSDLHSRLDEKERNNLNSSNLFQTKDSICCVNKKIEEIKIPKEITSISFLGFSDCENLTELVIPDNVISIGKGAFDNCSKLETVKLPNTISDFSDKIFFNCLSLKNINIPESLISIGESSFYNCQSIQELKLPASTKAIGSYCFKNCTSLTSINIPSGLMSLGEGAFFNCQSLEYVNIPNNIDTLNTYSFALCSSLKEVDIPENIHSINDFAFFSCDSLEKINLHPNMASIAPFAFSKCRSLKQISLPNSLQLLSHSMLDGCSSLESIVLPEGIKYLPPSFFKNCSSLETVDIPSKVSSIKNNAFEGCASLKSINFPADMKCIGSSAFYGCKSIEGLALPKKLNSLGSSAFDSCSSLEEIEIPDNVLNLQKMTFFNCEALKKVKLPKHLSSIGFKCFADCKELSEISFSDEIYSIDNSAFENCSSLTDIRFPDSLRVISQGAFSNCKNLNKVVIPEKIMFISKTAFENCPNLVICSSKGSYAHKYAVTNKIKFEEFNFLYLRRLSFKEDSITLNKGDIKKLDLIVTPENTTDSFDIKWKSSDDSVISVDNGVITCHKIGNAVITAFTEKKSAKCLVLSNIKLEKITLDKYSLELSKDQTQKLKLKYYPEEHMLQSSPIWKSSDPKVAVVDKSGNVTAIAPGKCSISCTLEDKSVACDIDINIPVTDIKFNIPMLNTKVGDVFSVEPIIYPADTTDNVVLEWQYSNKDIIEIQPDNTIKAVGEGTSIIMASYHDKIATCIVSITANINSIHFVEDKISLSKNKYFKPQLVDNNGSQIPFEKVTWSVADTTVARIEGENLKSLKEGITVLIAQMQGLVATAIITVLPDKINLFSINYVKEGAKVITGKGLKNAKIRAFTGATPISKTAVVDEKEEFILEIDSSKLSSEVVVEISKDGYETRKEIVPVLKEFKNFTVESIDEINDASLTITGNGHPEAHIRAYIKNMQIGKTCLTNEDGSFTLHIPRVKANTTITLKMRKSSYVTALKNITIKE